MFGNKMILGLALVSIMMVGWNVKLLSQEARPTERGERGGRAQRSGRMDPGQRMQRMQDLRQHVSGFCDRGLQICRR